MVSFLYPFPQKKFQFQALHSVIRILVLLKSVSVNCPNIPKLFFNTRHLDANLEYAFHRLIVWLHWIVMNELNERRFM